MRKRTVEGYKTCCVKKMFEEVLEVHRLEWESRLRQNGLSQKMAVDVELR